jgi:hypothetical protein
MVSTIKFNLSFGPFNANQVFKGSPKRFLFNLFLPHTCLPEVEPHRKHSNLRFEKSFASIYSDHVKPEQRQISFLRSIIFCLKVSQKKQNSILHFSPSNSNLNFPCLTQSNLSKNAFNADRLSARNWMTFQDGFMALARLVQFTVGSFPVSSVTVGSRMLSVLNELSW